MLNTVNLDQWISDLPKAELHLHTDGTLQAERLISLANKNSVSIPYKTPQAVELACEFTDLQSFLDLYYSGASVLRDADDFYHLMMDYLLVCQKQNIRHCEIMVEPQTYIPTGVAFSTMMEGFLAAIADAKTQWGQSVLLILSFLRHLSEKEALQMLDEAERFREHFVAIGLASSELGHPPEKFRELYRVARERGYQAVAHAGEEGPPEYIRDSLDLLHVDRIDHGVRCTEDPELVEYLRQQQIPLTVCPLSNVRLRVFDTMSEHNALALLDQGLVVTINSDDPAYFGGYLNENLIALETSLNIGQSRLLRLAENSFNSSFLSAEQKKIYLDQLNVIKSSI